MASFNEPAVMNAANTGQVREAERKLKNSLREQLDDMRTILSQPGGRRFLWRLMRHCRVNQSVFEPNSKMAYNSGMQDVGHFVLGEIIKAHPESYLQMMQENQGET